jgi:hypothetical protein
MSPEMTIMAELDDLKEHMTDQSYLACCTLLRRIYTARTIMSRRTLSSSQKRHLRRLFRMAMRTAVHMMKLQREVVSFDSPC